MHYVLTPEAQIWSVSLYGQRFRAHRTFYNASLTTMLNGQKRTKKMPKIQNYIFTILLTTLIETLPRSIHEFLGANLMRCRLKLLPPNGTMLTKTKKFQKSKI